MRILAKFRANRTIPCGDKLGHLSIFHDGGRPPSWIFKIWKYYNCPYSCKMWCRLDNPLRRYGHFSIFKMAAVCHIVFVVGILGAPMKRC